MQRHPKYMIDIEVTEKNAMKNVMLSSCNNVMKLFIAWWEIYKCLQTPLKIS